MLSNSSVTGFLNILIKFITAPTSLHVRPPKAASVDNAHNAIVLLPEDVMLPPKSALLNLLKKKSLKSL